jgi:iron-sulfur cluster assembly protein
MFLQGHKTSRPLGLLMEITGVAGNLDERRIIFIFAVDKTLIVMSESNNMVSSQPITLTDGAVRQLKQIREVEGLSEEHGLRVGVKGGGCAGFSYILGFDLPKEQDDIYEVNGIKVIMEKSHAIYLLGMEIDWVEGLNNRGFSFNNPNASDTCGCGTSFSA